MQSITEIPMDNIIEDDYSDLLTDNCLIFSTGNYYCQVGDGAKPEDRILYVSIIISQLRGALSLLIPRLSFWGVSFMIIKDKKSAKYALSGLLGSNNIGKVIVIYIPKHIELSTAIFELNELMEGFVGPIIPSHESVGATVYTDEVKNPFPKSLRVFNNRYLILNSLKSDPKGDVLMAFYIQGITKMGKCVIKEGRKYMWSDDDERDIRDRLKWQYHLHNDLKDVIKVPKVLDFFEEGGNSYLVMEYVKGIPLRDAIKKIYKERSWLQLSHKEKDRLLHFLLEVIEILVKIHEKAYVHRDLNTANFLLDGRGKIYAIDLELAYGIEIGYPLPPFALGSPGYMSEEQISGDRPTTKEDIYALGGVMAVFFTNIQPVKLYTQNVDDVCNSIYFFTGDHKISDLISKCFNKNPSQRPDLHEIKSFLTSFKKEYKNIDKSPILVDNWEFPTIDSLNNLIQNSFSGLTFQNLNDNGGQFISNGKIGAGLMVPMTTIVSLIHFADPENCKELTIKFFKAQLEKYLESFLSQQRECSPGLLLGNAGNSLLLQFGMLSGLISSSQGSKVQDCFRIISDKLDLASGIAGQLLAALAIYKGTPSVFFHEKLKIYVEIIQKSQSVNGSWSTIGILNGQKKILPGVENGVAGIIMSLIEFDKLFPDSVVKSSIEKGLKWLKTSLTQDQSFVTGSSGIALVYLYAYQHLKNAEYLQFAEKILYRFTQYSVNSDYSFSTGLSGIGFVYTEAARISNNCEWIRRSTWIYNIFLNSAHRIEGDKISWVINVGNQGYRTDLFSGVGGVILFLLNLKQCLKNIQDVNRF